MKINDNEYETIADRIQEYLGLDPGWEDAKDILDIVLDELNIKVK